MTCRYSVLSNKYGLAECAVGGLAVQCVCCPAGIPNPSPLEGVFPPPRSKTHCVRPRCISAGQEYFIKTFPTPPGHFGNLTVSRRVLVGNDLGSATEPVSDER
jgi:hypothetical protein